MPSQSSEMMGVPQAAASEQGHAGRAARLSHSGAREVQAKTLPTVELRVRARRHVIDALYIFRPDQARWIIRSGHSEASLWQASSRLVQQLFQRRLPIVAVASQVTEIDITPRSRGPMQIDVHATMQTSRAPRPKLTLHTLQPWTRRRSSTSHRTRGTCDARRYLQLSFCSAAKVARRVDVIKRLHAGGVVERPIANISAVVDAGADDHRSRGPNARGVSGTQLIDIQI